MESLFEALYSYALKNRFDTYSLRDQEERQETEKMLQIKDGYSILHFLNQRGAFWAGLNIGLEMHQL